MRAAPMHAARQLTDRWGNQWNLAQHIRDVSPGEMERATEAFAQKT